MHNLLQWDSLCGELEMATVTSAPVQNEVHVLSHCQDLIVCSLRKKYSFHFFLSASLLLWWPVTFCMPSFLNGTTTSAISSRTLWTIFWLAKTSNKTISLTTTVTFSKKELMSR